MVAEETIQQIKLDLIEEKKEAVKYDPNAPLKDFGLSRYVRRMNSVDLSDPKEIALWHQSMGIENGEAAMDCNKEYVEYEGNVEDIISEVDSPSRGSPLRSIHSSPMRSPDANIRKKPQLNVLKEEDENQESLKHL